MSRDGHLTYCLSAVPVDRGGAKLALFRKNDAEEWSESDAPREYTPSAF